MIFFAKSLLDVMLNEGEIDERDKLKYSVLFNKESFYCKASKNEWKGFLSIIYNEMQDQLFQMNVCFMVQRYLF